MKILLTSFILSVSIISIGLFWSLLKVDFNPHRLYISGYDHFKFDEKIYEESAESLKLRIGIDLDKQPYKYYCNQIEGFYGTSMEECKELNSVQIILKELKDGFLRASFFLTPLPFTTHLILLSLFAFWILVYLVVFKGNFGVSWIAKVFVLFQISLVTAFTLSFIITDHILRFSH